MATAVSAIMPNTKPPPGTETPVVGTVRMKQVFYMVYENSLAHFLSIAKPASYQIFTWNPMLYPFCQSSIFCISMERDLEGGSRSRILAPLSRQSRIPNIFHMYPENRFVSRQTFCVFSIPAPYFGKICSHNRGRRQQARGPRSSIETRRYFLTKANGDVPLVGVAFSRLE